MIRSLFCLLALSVALTFAAQAQAGHGCDGADGCGCHVQCPACHHYCKLSVDKEKVKKYCWEVECKPICVPRVHFPWECGCPPKCAKVKHVNVLKKKEYECEECKYTWTPEPEECCNAGGCGAGCCGAAGCDGACDAGCDVGCATSVDVTAPMEVQPPVAAEAQSAPELAVPPTVQRPTWLDSADAKTAGKTKAQAVKATATLPKWFLRGASKTK